MVQMGVMIEMGCSSCSFESAGVQTYKMKYLIKKSSRMHFDGLDDACLSL